MNRHHTSGIVLATAAALLVTSPVAAAAQRPYREVVVASVATEGEVVTERLCFIGQVRWSDALAGPIPRCPWR